MGVHLVRAAVVVALWLCGVLAGIGVWLWFGLVGPALVLVAVVSAAVLVFCVDVPDPVEPVEPEPVDDRSDRRVPGL